MSQDIESTSPWIESPRSFLGHSRMEHGRVWKIINGRESNTKLHKTNSSSVDHTYRAYRKEHSTLWFLFALQKPQFFWHWEIIIQGLWQNITLARCTKPRTLHCLLTSNKSSFQLITKQWNNIVYLVANIVPFCLYSSSTWAQIRIVGMYP